MELVGGNGPVGHEWIISSWLRRGRGRKNGGGKQKGRDASVGVVYAGEVIQGSFLPSSSGYVTENVSFLCEQFKFIGG